MKCGIEFTEPQELVQNGIIDAGYLSPGEEKSVDIDFKGIEEKGFKNIKYKIILNDGENEIEFEQRCDFNVAAYAKSAVVIDGNRDEWPDNIMMKAVGPGAFKALDGFMCRDEEDKSAGISVMWDEDNLYIYSEVTDDIYYQVEQPDKSWKGDGLQFGLYIDTGEEDSLAIGQAYTNFNEIGVSVLPDSNRVATYRFKTQNEKTEIGLCKTATGAVVRNGTKTYYEWSMPWEDITGQKGWKPKSGDRLGFSVLWNDNDGDGRKGWLEYASGIGVEKNRQLFTYLYFIK